MSDKIDWPGQYKPQNCPVHVRAQLESDLSPQRIWSWLVRADRWPTYLKTCSWVQLPPGKSELSLGSSFSWKVMNAKMTSSVLEFEAPHRLAWDGKGFGIDGYHAWLILPRGQGCRIISEECQKGWLAKLLPTSLFESRLLQTHEQWLAELVRMAAAGSPEALGARR